MNLEQPSSRGRNASFETRQALLPGLVAWLPDADALNGSALAMKEIVGLWVGR